MLIQVWRLRSTTVGQWRGSTGLSVWPNRWRSLFSFHWSLSLVRLLTSQSLDTSKINTRGDYSKITFYLFPPLPHTDTIKIYIFQKKLFVWVFISLVPTSGRLVLSYMVTVCVSSRSPVSWQCIELQFLHLKLFFVLFSNYLKSMRRVYKYNYITLLIGNHYM